VKTYKFGPIEIHIGRWAAGCAKVTHATLKAATAHAYRMEEKNPGEMFDAYRCTDCGFYHVGHTRKA
jgi:hypothetical protein